LILTREVCNEKYLKSFVSFVVGLPEFHPGPIHHLILEILERLVQPVLQSLPAEADKPWEPELDSVGDGAGDKCRHILHWERKAASGEEKRKVSSSKMKGNGEQRRVQGSLSFLAPYSLCEQK
jgi:hypothetical protein